MNKQKPTANIVYKTLGFKWLNQAFCPALAFVSADRDEARNPQRILRLIQIFGQHFMLQICVNQHKEFAGSQLQKPDILICF
jgi:hypothetical protein